MRFLTVIVLNKLRLSLRKPPCAWPFPDRRAALVEADLLPLGQPVGRDALAGAMLTQLLQQQGLAAKNAPGKLSAGELLDLVEKSEVGAACISVVSPSTVIQARYLCAKLRVRSPN